MKKLLLTLTILSTIFFLNGPAYAQEFTNESFQGNYAMKGSAGPNTVVLGVGSADGNGYISGPAIQRAFNNQRFEVTLTGTYTINADGTGTATGTLIDEEGEEVPSGEMDLVIMQAEIVNGVKLATEIFAVQRSGFMGYPPTFTMKRLPD